MNAMKNKLIKGHLYKFTYHNLYEYKIYLERGHHNIQYNSIFPQDAVVLYVGDIVPYYKEIYSKVLYRDKIVYIDSTDQKYLIAVT